MGLVTPLHDPRKRLCEQDAGPFTGPPCPGFYQARGTQRIVSVNYLFGRFIRTLCLLFSDC